MTDYERKSQKQRRVSVKVTRAVTALLRCRNIGEAAQATGFSESTLRRMRRTPEFITTFAQVQSEIFSQTCHEIRGLATDATGALKAILQDMQAPPAARTRAAGLILSLVLRIQRAETMELRLAMVEATLKKMDGGKRL